MLHELHKEKSPDSRRKMRWPSGPNLKTLQQMSDFNQLLFKQLVSTIDTGLANVKNC